MDRLQVAIEKARAQRAEALEARPEPAVGVPPPPDADQPAEAVVPEAEVEVPAPAPVPAAPEPTPAEPTAAVAEQAPAAALAESDVLEAAPEVAAPAMVPVLEKGQPRPGVWEGLKPIDDRVRQLRNNRLLTLKSGPSSVPFDLLRTRVLHQARQNGWRRIGIVSPTAGCGKTTAAANLAFAFSRQPELRIVLLDLDLRRPQLMQMLGQKVEGGMEDVLRGRRDFADHAHLLGSNVAIGFNEMASDAPSEVLQSDGASTALEQIEEDFAPDLVLIDLPPMMATDDNFGFLSKVDCVLLMVAAEYTTTDQIEVTLKQLGDLTSVMGIVLNKCHHIRGAYGFDSGYYSS